MSKEEQKALLMSAASELSSALDELNTILEDGISSIDETQPDYHDYQTCHELMLLANQL